MQLRLKLALGATALLLLTVALASRVRLSPVVAQTATNCGLASPAFCETFSQPGGGSPRSTNLPPYWGASRISQATNPNASLNDAWSPSSTNPCGNALPEQDVRICNGQLTESVNDGGQFTILAMYPKQPFDFAGRTGRVTFDVSADSEGGHAAWPAFVISDQPVPAPSDQHPSGATYARNSFGFTISGVCGTGNDCGSNCKYDGTESAVDAGFVTQNYVDTYIRPTELGCFRRGSSTALNHFEVDISSNSVTVYGTQPGTTSPLIALARFDVTIPLSRGLIWMEDVHYTACKFNDQCDHDFTWDNVGFDGPVLPRDLTFDVLDALTPSSFGGGAKDLGYQNATNLQTVPGITAANISAASGALLTVNWYATSHNAFTYSLNGNPSHSVPFPIPDDNYGWRTFAFAVPLSDLKAGTNTVTLSEGDNSTFANIDIILQGAGGIVPCNCGGGTPVPTQTATSSPSPVPTTPAPTASPTATIQPTPSSTPTQPPVTSTPTVVPTASATATPSPAACQVSVKVNGIPLYVDQPVTFCTGAHP